MLISMWKLLWNLANCLRLPLELEMDHPCFNPQQHRYRHVWRSSLRRHQWRERRRRTVSQKMGMPSQCTLLLWELEWVCLTTHLPATCCQVRESTPSLWMIYFTTWFPTEIFLCTLVMMLRNIPIRQIPPSCKHAALTPIRQIPPPCKHAALTRHWVAVFFNDQDVRFMKEWVFIAGRDWRWSGSNWSFPWKFSGVDDENRSEAKQWLWTCIFRCTEGRGGA